MEINFVNPPNRPMVTTFSPSTVPTMYKDTLFMDFSEDGHFLIGSTDVTATFWQGSLQVFPNYNSYTAAQHKSYYNSPILFDGKFLSDNKQIISESESKLRILNFSNDADAGDNTGQGARIEDCVEFSEAIKEIATWKGENKVLTASEKHIAQWDVSEGLKMCQDYTHFHTGAISGVDMKMGDCNQFVSVGRDRRTCLWDVRSDKVAMVLYTNEFCALTSVAWNPVDADTVVVGTQAGSIYMLDVRTPQDFVTVQHCHKKNIHKLQFSNDSPLLAVVANTNELQVYNCKANEFNLTYKNDDTHRDYLRDAKWFNGELYTCGLQSCVVKHSF